MMEPAHRQQQVDEFNRLFPVGTALQLRERTDGGGVSQAVIKSRVRTPATLVGGEPVFWIEYRIEPVSLYRFLIQEEIPW